MVALSASTQSMILTLSRLIWVRYHVARKGAIVELIAGRVSDP